MKRKRLFSRILACMLIITLLPVNAFADTNSVTDEMGSGVLEFESDDNTDVTSEEDGDLTTDDDPDMVDELDEDSDPVVLDDNGNVVDIESDNTDSTDSLETESDTSENSNVIQKAVAKVSQFLAAPRASDGTIVPKTVSDSFMRGVKIPYLGSTTFSYKYTSINGKNHIVYCLNKSKHLAEGKTYAMDDLLTGTKGKLIGLTIQYGYGKNNTYSSMTASMKSQYHTTQLVIWMIRHGYLTINDNNQLSDPGRKTQAAVGYLAKKLPSPSAATKCYETIKTGIKNELAGKDETLPTCFAKTEKAAKSRTYKVTLKHNNSLNRYEAVIKDTNGLLDEGKFSFSGTDKSIFKIGVRSPKEAVIYVSDADAGDISGDSTSVMLKYSGTYGFVNYDRYTAVANTDDAQDIAVAVNAATNVTGFLYATLQPEAIGFTISVSKVDSKDQTIKLEGAKFALQYFNTSTNSWTTAKDPDGDSYMLRDYGNGTYTLTIYDLDSELPTTMYPNSTRFRIRETSSPNGYSSRSLWTSSEFTRQDMVNDADMTMSFTAPNNRNSIQFGVNKISKREYDKASAEVMQELGWTIDESDESLYIPDENGETPFDKFYYQFEASLIAKYGEDKASSILSEKLEAKLATLSKISSPATFSIYEYSKASGGYKGTPIATFKSNELSARYYETDDNQGKFMVKETTAPIGYVGDYGTQISEDEDGNLVYSNGLNTYEFVVDDETDKDVVWLSSSDDSSGSYFTNIPQYGSIEIIKHTPVLKGITDSNDGGIDFSYDYSGLNGSGAVFNIVAAQDFKTESGTILYKNGDVVDTVTIGSDSTGKTSVQLPLGKYSLVETKAAPNCALIKNPISVTIEYAGQDVVVNNKTFDVNNDFAPVSVKVTKKDTWDNSVVRGAKLGLYSTEDYVLNGNILVAKDKLIAQGTTDSNGTVTFNKKLPFGMKLYVKEIETPNGYVFTDKRVDVVVANSNPTNAASLNYSIEYTNDEQRGHIDVTKYDLERQTNKTQGDASLEGAEYGLYTREQILHPNGSGTVLLQANVLVAKATTNADGAFSFENFEYNGKEEKGLFLGKYYVKEISPSEGYLLDETQYPVDLTWKNPAVKITTEQTTVNEQVIKQPFSIIKMKTDKDSTESELLEGVEFTIYLIKDLAKVKDGSIKPNENGIYNVKDFESYDFSKESPVIDYSDNPDGETAAPMVTDKKGYAESIPLAYGKYVVVETKHPEDVDPVKPFLVTITEDSRTPQTYRVLNDYLVEAYLKIIKKDSETGKSVLKENAKFKIYDVNNDKYVEQYYRYPKLTKIDTFETNGEGYLLTPEVLKAGKYRIDEVEAPYGYVLADPIEFEIPDSNVLRVEDESGAFVVEYDVNDTPQKGILTITKTGDTLADYVSDDKSITEILDKDNTDNKPNEEEPEVNDPNGVTTGGAGDEVIEGARDGSEDDEIDKEHKIASDTEYKGKFVYKELGVSGATFEVYAGEDIYTYDNQLDDEGNRIVYYKKDELVDTISTDSDGIAKSKEIPIGKYYVKETAAGHGFVLNKEQKEFEIKYAGQEVSLSEADVSFKNERQKVNIILTKSSTDNKELFISGAVYGLYTAEDIYNSEGILLFGKGYLIRTATTGDDGTLDFGDDLPLSKYFVKEITPPDGYLANDAVYDADGSYTDQNTEVNNISLNAEDIPTVVEFKKTDITGVEIPGAKLTVKDSDGNVIESWISEADKEHVVKGKLAIGKTYTLTEDLAPIGFLKSTDVSFTISDTGEIQKVEMVDELVKGKLIVNKSGEVLDSVSPLDKFFGYVKYVFNWINSSLEDVSFELYAAEDITNPNGTSSVFYSKDSLVATLTTDASGIATVEDLPLGHYYLKEIDTNDGFVLDQKPIAVSIDYVDQNTPVVTAQSYVTNTRQKTKIHLQKIDSETQEPLQGAIFGVFNYSEISNYKSEIVLQPNNLVATLTSDSNGVAELSLTLPFGDYYVKELQAPDGYVATGNIYKFTIDGKSIPQTNDPDVKSEDINEEVVDVTNGEETDQTTETSKANTDYQTLEEITFSHVFENKSIKVKISKQDITNSNELPGATLIVKDNNGKTIEKWVSGKEPHLIDKLPAGQYTLTEITAPDGYATAETVSFEVKETTEIQTVVMKDKPIKVKISKQDITNSKELPGATLIVKDKKGNKIEQWVSGDKPHLIEKLPVGEYTLTEITAPKGYKVAETVKFKVKDTEEIQTVVMKDRPIDKNVKAVKTGDTQNKLFVLVGLTGLMILLGASFLFRKKRR